MEKQQRIPREKARVLGRPSAFPSRIPRRIAGFFPSEALSLAASVLAPTTDAAVVRASPALDGQRDLRQPFAHFTPTIRRVKTLRLVSCQSNRLNGGREKAGVFAFRARAGHPERRLPTVWFP